MIELRKGRYHSSLWFLGGEAQPFDVFGSLSRELPDGEWTLNFRFRYHDGVGDDPFTDGDTKRWYSAKWRTDVSEEQALASCREVFQKLQAESGLRLHVLPVRTDDPKTISDALGRETWSHRRTASKEKTP